MSKTTFLLETEEEMNISAQYYNQQTSGLGFDFIEEINKSVQIIEKNPERFPFGYKNIRKYNSQRFPFSLLYVFEKDKDAIIIVAIAHQKRKPKYWKQRI